MSQTMENDTGFTDDEILGWLKSNPEFLTRNPEAIDFLIPPTRKDNDRKIADFQSYMIRRLKDDREDVIQSARDIVETSRANMNNQARIHKAILLLLEAHDFQDFIHTVTMDFAALLNVDIISLVIEIEESNIPHIDMNGVRVVGTGMIDMLTQKQHVLLAPVFQGMEEIYGGGAGLVQSQALMRLHIGGDNAPAALLAFGSRDPDMFHAGMGTDQIGFLGAVIERRFRLWLIQSA